jgi:hypothetical protein
VINSDSDLEKHSMSGTGLKEDPYIIEEIRMKEKFICINVENTTKHFIIRNCYIERSHKGICLNDVANGTATLDNNTITYGWFPEVESTEKYPEVSFYNRNV